MQTYTLCVYIELLKSNYILLEDDDTRKMLDVIFNSMLNERDLKGIHKSDKLILSRVFGFQLLNNTYYIFVTLDYTLINNFGYVLSNNYMVYISSPLYAVYKAFVLKQEEAPEKMYHNFRSSVWWDKAKREVSLGKPYM